MIIRWLEHVQSDAPTLISSLNGDKVLLGNRVQYLAGWPDDELWDRVLINALKDAGVEDT